MRFFTEAWNAGRSIVTGMKITFEEMAFRPAITVHYPEQYDVVPDWFRGIPVLKTNLLTGEYRCTSCNMCVEACPIDVITLEWHQDPATKKKVLDRFAVDMSRCMLCNYCIEACPFDSFVMASDYELGRVDPEKMVYELEDLLRIGLKYSQALNEPHGRGSKGPPTWLFATQTGATEADIQDPEGYLGRPPISSQAFKAKFGEAAAAKEE